MDEPGRHCGTARRLLLLALLVTAPVTNRAACLAYADPAIERLSQLIDRDPAAAAQTVREQIADARRGVAPGTLAALYSVLADASSALELDQDSLAAARSGLALVTDRRDPTYINLAYTHGINTYDMAGMQGELHKLEALVAGQEAGSIQETCALIGLGLLQHQAVRDDLSTISLTRAYRLSATPERHRQRIHAAKGLMYIARNIGDFDQALSLNQEVLEWDRARGATFELASAYYARGQIERYREDHVAALRDFQASRELRASQDMPQNLAFTDLRMCGSHLALGQLAEARSHCDAALDKLDAAQSPSPRKEAMGLLAAIDLQEGRPGAALTRLEVALEQDGADILPVLVPRLFELRGQAHAALGHYRQAMRDQESFLRLYRSQQQADRNLQAAVLRAQFETDRQLERNAALSRELALNGVRLRGMVYAAIAGGAIMLLLAYLLVANRRQARELARLADTDALTGLPNRRRTAELIQQMLERAARDGTGITIAVIDIDHFKHINDRFGHATGDRVLQDFATAARQSLRDADLVGRWGGEEFLAAMPGATLDVASRIMRRLRTALADVQYPSVSADLAIRVSVGLASTGAPHRGLDEIVAEADAALYEAKHAGRDTLRIARQSFDSASTGVRRALHVADEEWMQTG